MSSLLERIVSRENMRHNISFDLAHFFEMWYINEDMYVSGDGEADREFLWHVYKPNVDCYQ